LSDPTRARAPGSTSPCNPPHANSPRRPLRRRTPAPLAFLLARPRSREARDDRSATSGHEGDDDQRYGDQPKDAPRDHAASLPCRPRVARTVRQKLSPLEPSSCTPEGRAPGARNGLAAGEPRERTTLMRFRREPRSRAWDAGESTRPFSSGFENAFPTRPRRRCLAARSRRDCGSVRRPGPAPCSSFAAGSPEAGRQRQWWWWRQR
jgi:hypothetical protein